MDIFRKFPLNLSGIYYLQVILNLLTLNSSIDTLKVFFSLYNEICDQSSYCLHKAPLQMQFISSYIWHKSTKLRVTN